MKKLLLMFATACSVLCGCTSMGQLERGAKGPDGDESIIVIGVSSPNYRVILFSGDVRDGRFQHTNGPATIAGTARDGYLVGKARPGQVLGITVVTFVNAPSEAYGKAFYACRSAKAMVFKVPSPGVYYIGDLDYKIEGKSLRIAYSENAESARAHLHEFYPGVRGEVQFLDNKLLPVVGGYCDQTTYIPIYIGR